MLAKKDTSKRENNLASEKMDLNTSSYVIKIRVPYCALFNITQRFIHLISTLINSNAFILQN